MWLIADRDDDVHGHVDEPSVGVLLSWLINDDNNDGDHDDNNDGHGHNMALVMYIGWRVSVMTIMLMLMMKHSGDDAA